MSEKRICKMSNKPRCEKCASWAIGCGCVHSIAGKIWQPGINLAPICWPYTPMPAPEPSEFDRALAEHKRNFGTGGRYDERFRAGWNAAVEAAEKEADVHSEIGDAIQAIRKLEEKGYE